MKRVTEIVPGIHYVGANDRTKHRFEGLWPLPHGVSYNAYLIEDEKVALVDTIDAAFTERLLGSIRETIGDRPVDYLIINHMEPDHSASIHAVRQAYPDITIVGNAKTLQMVEGFYGISTRGKFPSRGGVAATNVADGVVTTANMLAVSDGDTLNLGKRTLQFFLIPMVHWPETMVTWCAGDRLVFSGDAFGTFGSLDGGITDVQLDTSKYWDEMVRYYSNIVGKYGGPVQKALEKLAPLRCAIVCPTHGPVWTRDFPRVLDLYDRMSRYEPLEKGVVIAYGSMYGNTEQTAERLARELAARGVTKIVMHNLSSSHASLVIRDIFKYSALVIGSPTYNMGLYPEVRSLLDDLELRCIPKRVFGCFGGFTWAGAAVKRLTEFAERTGWGLVAPPVEVKQGFSPEKTASCAALADAIAATM